MGFRCYRFGNKSLVIGLGFRMLYKEAAVGEGARVGVDHRVVQLQREHVPPALRHLHGLVRFALRRLGVGPGIWVKRLGVGPGIRVRRLGVGSGFCGDESRCRVLEVMCQGVGCLSRSRV